jgi:alkanesulfonate monooxygenase SsuD/methylene tetrahydromethanopterin reductase-like flavin-dependent oxidoreductase (luciferase family)
MGLPLALAIIGGNPAKFAPFADLYRRAAEASGHPGLPMSINSHGFIAETTEEATEESFIPFKTMMDRIGRERGWPEMTRAQFDASCELDGANFIGTPGQVTEKILHQHRIFNHDRLLIQFTVGTMPHEMVLRSIELFGTEVAPAVREQLAQG